MILDVINYVDDVLIASDSLDKHIDSLINVLKSLQNAKLTINLSKSVYLMNEVDFLGIIFHMIILVQILTKSKLLLVFHYLRQKSN